MNVSDPAQRARGPANGTPADSASGPSQDPRNGGGAAPVTLSRAERFEDEKRRIIQSCFGKKDADGSTMESYITHIRIVEDAEYPSSPPPPQASLENKKPRVIIVAVRKSSRVRVHKARENSNGSFSIGKTWALDDLTAIESFVDARPTTAEEEQRKQWAGTLGFLVTIQKPYYWQANTAKEKDFFIGSLIRIYRKYTGGRLPQLCGFDPQEFGQLAGGQGQQSRAAQVLSARRDITADNRQLPSTRESRPPTVIQRGSDRDYSNEPQQRPHQEQIPRNVESEDLMPKVPGQYPSSEFLRNLNPQNSRPQLRTPQSESSTSSITRSNRPTEPVQADNQSSRTLEGTQSIDSFRSASDRQREEVPPSSQSSLERLQPNENMASSYTRDMMSQQRSNSPNRSVFGDRFSTPAATREPSKDDMYEPLRSQVMPKTDDSQSPDSKESHDNVAPPPPLSTSTAPTVPPEPPPEPLPEPKEEEVHRPGLGPMIKKKSNKEIASAFRKAATAYTAFRPRPGGAAEKLRGASEVSSNEPDGINAVVPAPSLLRRVSQDSARSLTPDQTLKTTSLAPESRIDVPQVQITSPAAVTTDSTTEGNSEPPAARTPSPEKPSKFPENVQEDRRRKRRSDHSAKYAKALGIDPSLLEGRTFDIDTVLDEFGMDENDGKPKSYEELKANLQKEIARVEMGSWVGGLEQNDERVDSVGRIIDKGIAECEDFDSLLTLYSHELATLNEDVAYIEAQSQGLQVQTANQKLLQIELKTLLDNISIPASQLQVLKEASLKKPEGIQATETALSQLYKAMLTIDPKLQQNGVRVNTTDQSGIGPFSTVGITGREISNMHAVQEKKESYHRESTEFLYKLKQFMSTRFLDTGAQTARALETQRNNNLGKPSTKLDFKLRQKSRNDLFTFSPLMLFARQVESFEWEDLMRMYEASAKKPYQDELRDNVSAWKRTARLPVGEEQDSLFTAQEKEAESIVGRKLTVKRSKTVRSEGISRITSGEKGKDGKLNAYEVFAAALNETSQAIYMEQNFIVELFHLSSLESIDFLDVVAAAPPAARRVGDLTRKQLFDPNRDIARRLVNIMDEIFSFWSTDMQSLVDWATKVDALQGVGLLYAIETKLSELEESNQEFLTQALSKMHERLAGLFARFVEEQIRGIEDTKVKIKKRKGVIAFIKTFPNFSTLIENMLPAPHSLNQPEIRFLVNDAYQKINKAMFESLKFIAKESPTVMAGPGTQGQAGGDPEDKEVLNYHILLIENMNHYIEEVDVRGNIVLEDWKDRAFSEMNEHLDLYLAAVIRRPLGKLLDFLESTESLLLSTPSAPSVGTRASHSRSTFKKLLSTYDAKEIRRGIETLRKRVEKHFGDADDPGLSKGLVGKVLRECENKYNGVGDRAARIVRDVYEGGLEVEWKREDVSAAFRR
ncbi:Exocyst complex, component 1/SEC3 [Lasallia pustulata]|uniref:Exocyst complex, component 1/SEC3 n=1 Tax=Lasallia pustulata TaxID=136370 RepID=A0A1W5CYL1_9LECA|nr:Exocyst complex, component 1/SEC3 [Lasallia pustulata]